MKVALDLAVLGDAPEVQARFASLAAILTGTRGDMEFVPVASSAADGFDFPPIARQMVRQTALLATGARFVLTFATDAALFLSRDLALVAAPTLRVAVAVPEGTAIPSSAAGRAVCWIPVPTEPEDAARTIVAALRQDVAENGVPVLDFAYRQPNPPTKAVVAASGEDSLPHRRAALITPFPPLQSGVADYSVEITEPLTQFYDLDLYTTDGYEPRLPPGYKALGHAALERALRVERTTHPYDLLIYQFGNNYLYHAEMYSLLRRYAGIVVLHDYILADFVYCLQVYRPDLGIALRDELTHHAGAAYADEKIAKLERGQLHPRELIAEKVYLTRRLFTRSLGVIVHNQWSYDMAMEYHAQDNPLITLIPPVMPPVPLDDTPESIAALRRKYGIPVDAFVIAPCGIVTKSKRPLEILHAFRAFLADRPDAHLVFVGSINPEHDLDVMGEIAWRGLTDKVTISGYVDIPTFNEYLRLSDVCVTLRYPSQGETSGALLRMLVHGKASIVTDIGSFANFPDDTVHKLPIPAGMSHDDEVAMILAAFRRLSADADYRRDLGARGAAYIHHEHSPERCARLYAEFGETVLRHPATYAKLAADNAARRWVRQAPGDPSLAGVPADTLFTAIGRVLAADGGA